jgi:NAD-dependent deacetylase
VSLARYKNIVVLTGAGISQAAGLPTYRGPGGVWNDPEKIALADVAAMRTRRREACAMLWQLYESAREVQPTAAHRALAAFEAGLPPSASFLLVTQNVDGLHQAAGSNRVCELHGSLARWRCDACGAEEDRPRAAPVHCDQPMRPGVVLFGEEIPVDAEHATTRALRDCDLFVAVGTSGSVLPASLFVKWAEYAGARRILLNLEIDDEMRELYPECDQGTADDLVPRWFA